MESWGCVFQTAISLCLFILDRLCGASWARERPAVWCWYAPRGTYIYKIISKLKIKKIIRNVLGSAQFARYKLIPGTQIGMAAERESVIRSIRVGGVIAVGIPRGWARGRGRSSRRGEPRGPEIRNWVPFLAHRGNRGVSGGTGWGRSHPRVEKSAI